MKLTLQGQKVHDSNRLDEANAMVPLSFSYLSYQKKLSMKNHLRKKTMIFHLVTSGAKIDDRLSLIEERYRGMKRALQCLFDFFLASMLLEKIGLL